QATPDALAVHHDVPLVQRGRPGPEADRRDGATHPERADRVGQYGGNAGVDAAGVTSVAGGFAGRALRDEIVMSATAVSGCESRVLGLTPPKFHLCCSQHVVL
ncbi:hypothetical protein, partial [Nocardia farcinica]|uniref:hypothetical protein n=1 Tax=Nocardia farcinica TaxID=37329 RepID=UPI0024547249